MVDLAEPKPTGYSYPEPATGGSPGQSPTSKHFGALPKLDGYRFCGDTNEPTNGEIGKRRICIAPHIRGPDQVEEFQTLMGIQDGGNCQKDSWGLKRLLSHGYRRWCSGAARPKVVGLDLKNVP